jgi:hypothetical protein
MKTMTASWLNFYLLCNDIDDDVGIISNDDGLL